MRALPTPNLLALPAAAEHSQHSSATHQHEDRARLRDDQKVDLSGSGKVDGRTWVRQQEGGCDVQSVVGQNACVDERQVGVSESGFPDGVFSRPLIAYAADVAGGGGVFHHGEGVVVERGPPLAIIRLRAIERAQPEFDRQAGFFQDRPEVTADEAGKLFAGDDARGEFLRGDGFVLDVKLVDANAFGGVGFDELHEIARVGVEVAVGGDEFPVIEDGGIFQPGGRAPRRGEQGEVGPADESFAQVGKQGTAVAFDGEMFEGKITGRLGVAIPVEAVIVGPDGQAAEVEAQVTVGL